MAAMKSVLPPYLNRACFVPRKVEDVGDSELSQATNVARYSLSNDTLPVITDSHGNVDYNNAIVKQNDNTSKIVHKDLVPKILRDDEETEEYAAEPEQKEIDDTTQETNFMLDKIVNVRLGADSQHPSDSKFIKYQPSSQQQSEAAFNSGAKERIIRMVMMPVDTLEPPKFKHKRVPKANSGSPPVPVMHSPPRPVTVKDEQDWKIPPCVSNWKNPKGYTIRLDKRLLASADGRGLQEVQINDNFAKLSETLYVAEQKAREAVAMRSRIQKEMLMKAKEKKEQELLALAQKARFERIGGLKPAANASLSHSENSAMDSEERRSHRAASELIRSRSSQNSIR